MSVIVAAIGLTLTVAMVGLTGRVAAVSVDRARAQAAADAAALAAAAESAPYGGGRPEAAATRLAEMNGSTLIDCACVVGATAMQVEVRAGSVTARARAELDPTLLVPSVGPSTQGLDPRLARALQQLLRATAGTVRVVSGFRSPTEQRRLWAAAVARYGSAEAADDHVARPGTSMHERGLAVDLAGDLERAAEVARRLGLPLVRPLPHEPWHFELQA